MSLSYSHLQPHESLVWSHSPVKKKYYADIFQCKDKLSNHQVQFFAVQWYAFSSSITKLLALCAWKAETEEERANVVKNLYSELGLDVSNGKTHSELLKDLIENASNGELDTGQISPTTSTFISTINSAVLNRPPAFVAGFLLGLEHVAYDILEVLKGLLDKSGNGHLKEHPYIKIHEEVEAMHIDSTENTIDLYDDRRSEVEEGFVFIMKEWEQFWADAYIGMASV